MKSRRCGVVPLDTLEERMAKGVKSALGEECTITVRVIYGVIDEEFKLHQLTLSEVEDRCRNWSESHPRKNEYCNKPETSSIAEWLKVSRKLEKIEYT